MPTKAIITKVEIETADSTKTDITKFMKSFQIIESSEFSNKLSPMILKNFDDAIGVILDEMYAVGEIKFLEKPIAPCDLFPRDIIFIEGDEIVKVVRDGAVVYRKDENNARKRM